MTSDENISGPNTIPDPINNAAFARDLYFSANPEYSGRFSVPVLWDREKKTIVSNESSEIIRMFSTEFDGLVSEEHRSVELVPKELEGTIDDLNAWIYVSQIFIYDR